MATAIETYWQAYLAATNKSKDEATFSGELIFEDTGIVGMNQLVLVLTGQKTAAFLPFESYSINMEPIPVTGEVYIVEDTELQPRCIIEVTDVKVIPYDAISWEIAQKDGEDQSMEDWRAKTAELFEEEAELCGFDFNGQTKIVCEFFRVIYHEPFSQLPH